MYVLCIILTKLHCKQFPKRKQFNLLLFTIQWNLLITDTQGTGQKWPLCTGDRYRQVGYNMGSLVGTY